MKYLIFGNGYIGNKFLDYLGDEAEMVKGIDIANLKEVSATLKEKKPEVVINCVGKKGRPNVDWCEDHKEETMYSNVAGPIILSRVCMDEGVFFVHLGSGCIYQGDNGGKGFSEEDIPSIEDMPSFYSLTKFVSEYLLKYLPILQVRLRLPIDSEKSSANTITKLTSYDKIIDVDNSISAVDDFIYATIELIKKRKTGIYNVTNPGKISHKEIIGKYKELVEDTKDYEFIPAKALKTRAGRSSCVLNTQKLESEGIKIKDVHEKIEEILRNYA